MRFPTPVALLLTGLLTTTLACDKRPPTTDDQQSTDDAQSTDKPTADDSRTSNAETTNDQGRTTSQTQWKTNDIHTHVGPTAYPIVEKLLAENDIYRIANMSGGNNPEGYEHHMSTPPALTNRIAPFYTPDWSKADQPDFGENQADKLEEAVEHGYAGLKISKALGLSAKNAEGDFLAVDAPRLDPLWERAGELGVPVLIHTGDPKAFFKKPGPKNERWEELKEAPDWSFHDDKYPSRKSLLAARDRMVARHDDTTFILAHMGNNPENMRYIRELLEQHDHLYVDTAARVAEFGRHPAQQIRQFFIDFQDRILFGSDLGVHARARQGGLYYSLFLGSISKEPPRLEDVRPFFEKHWRYFETDKQAVAHPIPIQGDWKVHPINLPTKVLDKIYWRNSERLLFAPWLGRRAAQRTAARARSLTARRPSSTSP